MPDHEHASAKVDESIRQEHAGSHVPAAFLVPLDALESRGKDDCLRTPPLCARVRKQLGSSKVFSGLQANVDFLGGESDDLLAAERSMHLEGKTNGKLAMLVAQDRYMCGRGSGDTNMHSVVGSSCGRLKL